MAYSTTQDSFVKAVADAGIHAPEHAVADGQLHRFSSNGKPSDKAGYYVLHALPNGKVAGIFGCWRSGVSQKWSSMRDSDQSLEAKLTIKASIQKAKAKLQEVTKSRAEYAMSLLASSQEAKPDHEYAKRKGNISLQGVYWKDAIHFSEFFDNRESKGTLTDALLIPVRESAGKILTVQAITGDGAKFFMSGGTVKGGMFTFHGDTDTIYIAEGYATAASVFDATGKTVVCAFNANNLLVVAPIVKAQFPEAVIIVAADNDASKEAEGKGNKGKEVADKLFNQESLPYSMPNFDEVNIGTDWNDYACAHGNEALAKALENNLVKPIKPTESFDEAMERLRCNEDDTKAFNEALRHIYGAEVLHQSRMKKQLKDLTGVPLKDMNSSLSAIAKAENFDEMSHSDIARKFVCDIGEIELVGAYGALWSYRQETGLWQEKKLAKLSTELPISFNDQVRCQRVADYNAIAGHIYDLKEDAAFFETAPYGLNTPNGFLCVNDGHVVIDDVSPLHRARHRLDFIPAEKGSEPTQFLTMLQEAFAGCHPEEQIRQLRMALGLTLFGLMPQQQRAIFLYGAAGSGKSVALKILSAMLPPDAVTSVSPAMFDSDYHRAAIAGKRCNLVPEMNKDKPIPSAEFKSIIGGDKVSAREPHGKVFTHTPCATNWFNGNFFPKTTDHTEGFYRRWLITHFNNTKPDSERDPGLLDRIIASELPAILRWAIDGVEDYLENGLYMSPAHTDCLAQWKNEGNSVQGWLSDSDDNFIEHRQNGDIRKPLKYTEAYGLYRDWCARSGVRAYGKSTFFQHMEQLGHTNSLHCGYRVFSKLRSNMADILGLKAA